MALLATLGVVGLFILLYAVSVHAYTPDSDTATVALEGQAMTHGHLLLNGWAISLDSFWLIDALWYLIAVVLFGLHPAILNAVPAAIATVVIVIGIFMAVEGRRRSAALAAAGTVVAILALPGQALAFHFLRGPLHVGTALWCLVAFLGLRRGRFGWGFAVAVVFMAAGLLGDLQMLTLGVIPISLAGLTATARRRDWRAGLPQVTASISAIALAFVAREIARMIGTFAIANANPVASLSQMVANLKQGVHEGVAMMGVGSSYWGLGAVPRTLSYAHVAAIVVIFAAVAGTFVGIFRGALKGRPTVVGASSEAAWRLDDMLAFGALGSFMTFVVLAISLNPGYGRYLTAGILFGTILAGRVVGRVSEDLHWVSVRRLAAGAGLAASACFAAGMAINLDLPVPVSKAALLATWLESHGLHDGIGSYWAASIVTVESSGRVEVRPVVSPDGIRIVRYNRNSAAYWYTKPFQFLVFNLGTPPWGNVTWQTAVNTFGRPSKSYIVEDTYRVMVWSSPVHVLPQVVSN